MYSISSKHLMRRVYSMQAGLATALYLAEHGVEVTCVDSHAEVGQETSFLNGALVCPSLTYPWANGATLKKLMLDMIVDGNARQKYIHVDKGLLLSPPFVLFGINFALNSLLSAKFDANYMTSYHLSMLTKRCLQQLSIDTELSGAGSLQLFSTEADRDAYFTAQSRVVPDIAKHQPAEAAAFEPALSDPSRFLGGFIHSDIDRTMDSYKLCDALRRKAERLGVQFVMGKKVAAFSFRPNIGNGKQKASISSALLDDGTKLSADIFVAANGNDSNTIAEWAGDGRHSWPIRGFVLDTPTSPEFEPLRHAIVDDVRKVYIAPLGSRRVRISGLCDVKSLAAPSRISENDQRERCSLLFGQAKALMPERFFLEPMHINFQDSKYSVAFPNNDGPLTTANITVDDTTAVFHSCQRPQTADDLPVIGQSGNISNLYYNSGHGHLGLTRSLGSAKILAGFIFNESVSQEPALNIQRFSPTRFQLLPSKNSN